MRKSNLLPVFLIGFILFSLTSCSSEATGEEGKSDAEVLTTDMLIEEANKIGKDEFEKKYPQDSEIEIQGEARFPATWDDKIAVKFGSGMNDLPITADFMFTDNGGTKESTDDQITSGEILHFKGKVGMTFFDEKGKLSRLSISDCKVL